LSRKGFLARCQTQKAAHNPAPIHQSNLAGARKEECRAALARNTGTWKITMVNLEKSHSTGNSRNDYLIQEFRSAQPRGLQIILRPFQLGAVQKIEFEIANGQRKLIYVAPTGSGKTVVASELTKRLVARWQRVLFIAHRREIIDQTSRKLTANGVKHGIIQAERDADLRPMESVQVASIQTLWARAMRSKAMQLPLADTIIIDEAHHGRARTYQKLIETYPDAAFVGLTATPCRGDGRGLGNIFDTMIEAPQVGELIRLGFLVPTLIYAPVDEDIAKGVRTEKGDYVVGQLSRRMNTYELVGDLVSHWLKYSERRRTVAFAVDVAHSVHIRDEFLNAGVRAEHLDGGTPIPEREAILNRLRTGETEVVSNCMVLTEGWDMPDVGCCILARPTKQQGLFRQMIGRVLRPAEGKPNAIILDHSGAVYRHGRPEDRIEWTLDVDRRAENPIQAARKRGDEAKLKECPSCKALMTVPPCTHCGWMPAVRRGRDVDFADGQLGLYVDGVAQAEKMRPDEQLRFYRELRGFARERGMKDGWAFHQCREGRGFTPPWAWRDYPLLDPSPATRAWAKSRLIRYAKRRHPSPPRGNGNVNPAIWERVQEQARAGKAWERGAGGHDPSYLERVA
jgi:DNA repair protein RadD